MAGRTFARLAVATATVPMAAGCGGAFGYTKAEVDASQLIWSDAAAG